MRQIVIRIVTWLLFQTLIGDRLIGLIERYLGIGVVPVEILEHCLDGPLSFV